MTTKWDVVGCRVVRGPDWKWNDQDGGEGGVGTIISTDTFSDGSRLNQKTVLVLWDIGLKADYRLGKDGECDLRILDSVSSGVCSNRVVCDGCEQNPLLGTRWECADCDDYDLCTHCYNNDVHDLDHSFNRYDHYDLPSTPVGPRSSAVKVQAKGIFPGSDVTTGKDSVYELGHTIGKVIMDHRMNNDIPVGKVLVEWRTDLNSAVDIEYSLGFEGKVELKLERFAPSVYYYRDHLMTPRISISDIDETFVVEDKVTVHLDVNDLHQIMLAIYGSWEPEMERGITGVGVVEGVYGDKVSVRYETPEEMLLLFPLNVLSKVHELRVEDRVTISSYKEKVIILQKDHRGWNDEMEKITVVIGKQEGDTIRLAENLVIQETSFAMADVDDPLEGLDCAPLQSANGAEELESSDEDEDEGVFVRPTNLAKIPWYDQPHQTDNVYKMTSNPRGVVMIVNIQRYNISELEHPMYGKLEDRVGSKKDEDDVTLLFQHLNFIVEKINKTSANQLLAELKRISTEYHFSEFDCFVLFIMSHGTKNCIYASDGGQITSSLIISLFRNCKKLAGKPKLFFFQGCRGGKEDRGVTLADAAGDPAKTFTTQDEIADEIAADKIAADKIAADKIAETADILEFYSSYSGYQSYRNSETGSPFVQSIVEVFRKKACRHHVLELVTKVAKRVSEESYLRKKQMPHHNATLTKHLYFWPGVIF